MLGAAGYGGSSGGSDDLIVSWIPDDTGSLNKLISQFNKQSKDFKVQYRQKPIDSMQYFDKLTADCDDGAPGKAEA